MKPPSYLRSTIAQTAQTRVLNYIAQIQVDNPDVERKQFDKPRIPKTTMETQPPGIKQMLDEQGPEAVSKWVLDQKKTAPRRYHHA